MGNDDDFNDDDFNDDDFNDDDLLLNPTHPTDPSSQETLALPPLSDPDIELLRAVAARAAATTDNGQIPPLRALISAYDALAAERRVNAAYSAPVHWGYLLRMAEGAGLDELIKEQTGPATGETGRKNRRTEKL